MYSSCEYICPWKRENILEISEHSGRGGYESAFSRFHVSCAYMNMHTYTVGGCLGHSTCSHLSCIYVNTSYLVEIPWIRIETCSEGGVWICSSCSHVCMNLDRYKVGGGWGHSRRGLGALYLLSCIVCMYTYILYVKMPWFLLKFMKYGWVLRVFRSRVCMNMNIHRVGGSFFRSHVSMNINVHRVGGFHMCLLAFLSFVNRVYI